jgi:hypothetical protein
MSRRDDFAPSLPKSVPEAAPGSDAIATDILRRHPDG